MKIIKPFVELLWITPNAEKMIELATRTCYKSEDKITEESSAKLIKMLIEKGHDAMLEHASASLRFICDRGVTHEFVRHRIGISYAQESTRYCNYSKDKFGNELTFIKPCFFKNEKIEKKENDLELDLNYIIWENTMKEAEENYKSMINNGATPQEARSVLPNSLKTEIVASANMREWRYIIKLRTSKFAHPQIVEIMLMAKEILKKECRNIFGDL